MQILDATGLQQPVPVLQARRKLQEMDDGDVLQIKATDPAGVHDFPAFCSQNGHHLIMAHVQDGIYFFEIEKASLRANEAS